MDGFIIPSSIQRVRSFLVEMYGMKVKPWANTEETLAALHAMLVARQHCDRFWASLRELLERLAADLKKREVAAPGTLLDNEVLDSQRYEALLREIRACLAQQTRESTTGSFRRLASGLSAPALGLLLLLGGAATVGCDQAALKGGPRTQDAAVQPDARAGQPDVVLPSADANDAQPAIKMDVAVVVPPDAPPVPPDVAPPWDAVAVGPDGAVVSIQDIMNSCNVSELKQREILGCLGSLRASWTTGLVQELAGRGCSAVVSRLESFACYSEYCEPRLAESEEFADGATPYCMPSVVYFGVRFV